jgi:hypothetical protein
VSDFITFTKVTEHPVTASCLLGSPLSGAGLPGVVFGNERPIKASEVAAAAAEARVYACASAATGAIAAGKQTQHRLMWAFRGLEPWRDPA